MSKEHASSQPDLQQQLEQIIAQFAREATLVIIQHMAQQSEAAATAPLDSTLTDAPQAPQAELSADAALLAYDETFVDKDQRYHHVMQKLRKLLPGFLSDGENLALEVDHALTQFDEIFKRLNVPFKIMSFKTRAEVVAQLRQVRRQEEHPLNGYPFLFFLYNRGQELEADIESADNPTGIDEVILWIYVSSRKEILKSINLNEQVIRTPRDAGIILLEGMVKSDQRMLQAVKKLPKPGIPPEADTTNPFLTELRDILTQLDDSDTKKE